MEEIKTLATCSDIEFLVQSNKIRHAVENWMDVTDINSIRKRLPKLDPVPEDADEEKAAAIKEKNEKKLIEQGKKNMDAVLDSALEKHPEETVKIIRLCCFVDPDDNSRPIVYYIKAFSEMIKDENVLNFLSSLGNLGQTLGLTL
jgi:hypothetical protein